MTANRRGDLTGRLKC